LLRLGPADASRAVARGGLFPAGLGAKRQAQARHCRGRAAEMVGCRVRPARYRRARPPRDGARVRPAECLELVLIKRGVRFSLQKQPYLRYCASLTFSIHSTFLPLSDSVTAICDIAVVAVAPCQCFSPGGNHTTSPGRISSIGPPSVCAQPRPDVTMRV